MGVYTQLPDDLEKVDVIIAGGIEGVHGNKGPITVFRGTYRANKSQDDFISAAAQVGYPEYLDLQDLDIRNIKAEKMVVISAGALGSPLLLKRSGVGDSAILETAGVPLIAHIPALLSGYPGDPTGIDPGQYLAVSIFTVYPYSHGHIHTNSFDLDDPPDFATGFFTDPLDVKKHIWSYKKQREIIRRMQTYRGEMAATHPTFPNDSAAALIEIDKPLTDVTDIQYTAEDDAIIEKWARENVGTTWHSLSTCNMALFDQGGVVNATLSVYSVENLKIADLNIPPQNVAANTANTAMAIGERAADIFIQELGLGN
ncbi:GMC oxidoreductase [Seiridium cupressi]